MESAGAACDQTHECRPWTPPSIWADMVRFSNLSSPEYIMDLAKPTHSSQVLEEHPDANLPGVNGSKLGFTEEWTNSSLLCPDSRAGSLLWGTGRTCVWSPCPVLILIHPGPPSPDPPHWNHNVLMLVWTWHSINCCQSKGRQPKVAFLAIIFLHGIQGAHSSVFFQTHTIREKVFSWSFSGRSQ